MDGAMPMVSVATLLVTEPATLVAVTLVSSGLVGYREQNAA